MSKLLNLILMYSCLLLPKELAIINANFDASTIKIVFIYLFPPEPLKSLSAGYTAEWKNFLSNIRKYNSYFQMASIDTKKVLSQYIPTFKVKGNIYHR